ncbi:MAG: hypothetical protein HOP37_04610 [Cyclobacteriaceae bacterium]|nr:hypothetical protein [Cyclobacteriaceae bacterium]
MGHSLYSVLARGATLENFSVYSYYSVKYWCGGAALLAKLWPCGWDCAGFGKCAAWVGYTFWSDVCPDGGFKFLSVGYTLMDAYFNFLDALNCLACASFNLMDAPIYLMDVSFNFPESLNYLEDAPF